MESLKCKTRLAVLWLIQSINFMAYLILQSVQHQVAGANQVRTVEEAKAALSFISIIFFIYLLMAWLSLTLKDKCNRPTNLIVGIIFAVLLVMTVLSALRQGAPSAILFTIVFGFAVFLLTIWYAWKLPKEEAP